MKYLFILLFFCSCYNTYYVVRHAEKVLTPPNAYDPPLTNAGQQRSNDLNTYLGKRKPDSIFVSTFLRTQQTAAPTATAAGVTPIIINQTDTNSVNAFITRLYKMNKKKVLVVGHTNTVPRIVKGLSGQTINTISEVDYDNIYIIKIRRTNRQLIQATYGVTSP